VVPSDWRQVGGRGMQSSVALHCMQAAFKGGFVLADVTLLNFGVEAAIIKPGSHSTRV
jgi:hypothetical protein